MPKISRILMIVVAAAAVWGCANSGADNELKVEKSGMVSAKATVEAVDLKKREVLLKGPSGKTFTVHAGDQVANLPQVKVGDEVEALYYEALAVRMAKPGEMRDDTSQESGRAKPGSKPGGYEIAETTVTAKILDIDKPRRTVTLKMPDGYVDTVKVRDPANLEKVKVGDNIVITYTEALAVSLKELKK